MVLEVILVRSRAVSAPLQILLKLNHRNTNAVHIKGLTHVSSKSTEKTRHHLRYNLCLFLSIFNMFQQIIVFLLSEEILDKTGKIEGRLLEF